MYTHATETEKERTNDRVREEKGMKKYERKREKFRNLSIEIKMAHHRPAVLYTVKL